MSDFWLCATCARLDGRAVTNYTVACLAHGDAEPQGEARRAPGLRGERRGMKRYYFEGSDEE